LFSIVNTSATDTTKIVKPLAPSKAGKKIDQVYTAKAKIDGKDTNVAFDTTVA
jgi:hypothetical protein